MSDLLSGIFHKLSSNPAVARITAAILTPIVDRIAAWLSRPKHAKAHDEPRTEIVRSTETVETTVLTTWTVEVERTTVGKR
jgi:hypothetical protein